MEKLALRFTKYGRDGIEHEITVYGTKMDGFVLEQALKQGWRYHEEDLGKRETVVSAS